ncbi:glucose 1-dehydrogenase [Streptomyces sp. ISL-96]|uniref:glucose 1-dehydrogenase n=1 Tax=Streptomyces sp. ISL-96 TaxID=2819191 RepID=UPI0027E276E8|nr:glucose 1-dehydrogenase [Streptomyces sp. ISL-96]
MSSTPAADVFAMEPPETRLLDGRKALVTGADSGIGQAIAYQLAANGASVAINHLGDSKVADAMAQKIEKAGGKAISVPMDVTQEEQVRRAFALTADAFDGLDLLVNNAGIERPVRLVDMELEWWQKVIDVNLTGTFLCSREAARIMLERGSRGTIVNITSVHETIPWAEYSHYCASKGGQRMFAQSIARELAPYGIRVVSVAPGAIETPINQDVVADPQRRKAVQDEIPLGRWGNVSDVAGVVAFLASERADYIVGSTVFVDGGMTLYPRFD